MSICKQHLRNLQTWLLIILVSPVSGFAMPSPLQQQAGDAHLQWRARSEALTDDLLKDAGQLSPMRRAVVLARLAQRWSEDDQEHARKWFQNAVDLIEQVPGK
jgi:hypothetical protein